MNALCNKILTGDACEILRTMPADSVDCCVTSPPYYGLRDYEVSGQIGLDRHPNDYIARLTAVFMEIFRVIKKDGILWIVIGDSYAGSGMATSFNSIQPRASTFADKPQYKRIEGYKHKDLMGVPFMLAFALRNAGWYWRACNIWHKPSVLPESVKDRPTNTHEYILLFSKNLHYYYDYNAIMEKSACDSALLRNKRSVWTINTKPLHEAHFAAYPPKLVEPMILAGCRKDGIVLDPFMGAGTTALTARKLGRNYVGIELNPQYVEIAQRRLQKELGMFI